MPPRTRPAASCCPAEPHYARGFCRRCYYLHGVPRALCHPDRPAKSHSNRKCSSCTTLARIARNPPSTCHPDRPARRASGGLCVACETRRRRFGVTARVEDHPCAICLRAVHPRGGRRGGWRGTVGVVDHCHACGGTRAILCSRCNVLIGQAQDDPRILAAAATYLRKHACH